MSARGVLIGVLAVFGAALAISPAAAAGRHGGRHGGTKVQLAELLAAAQAQQGRHDLTAARASLEQAYELQPSAATLCALGSLAAAEGRLVEAQDKLRRCHAADPAAAHTVATPAANAPANIAATPTANAPANIAATPTSNAPANTAATRTANAPANTAANTAVYEAANASATSASTPAVNAASTPAANATSTPASAPPTDSGELSIVSPHRGLVFVDSHVVATLPLALPLLLTPGSHQVQLALGAHRVSAEVQVLAGRAATLSFAGKPTVKPLPAVALLVDFSHSSDEAGSQLLKAATQAVQEQRLGVLGQWGALGEKFELSSCADAACEQTLAQRHQLRYVVAARAIAEPDGWQLWTQLFDAEVGDVASQQATDCERCTVDQAGARLRELVTQTLHLGQSRPTGILEITSTPPGGEVLLGGLRLGQTPLRRAAFAGEHAIVVQHAGFLPYQNEVVVEPGRGAALDATLRAGVPPTLTPPQVPAVPPETAATTPPEPGLLLTEPAARTIGVAPRPVAAAAPGRAARPRWRVGMGAAITAAGALLLGFGITGLAIDGRCTQSPIAGATGELCPSGRVINSGGTGGALLAAGLATVGVGATLWALPGTRPREVQAPGATTSDHTAADGAF